MSTFAPPQVWALWQHVRDRLRTPRMAQLLGGTNRVYVSTEAHPEQEAPGGFWGRVVVVPVRLSWNEPDRPGRHRPVRWLVRADVRQPGPAFDPTRQVELIHTEAFQRLHGYLPGEIEGARITSPMTRTSVPTAAQYDAERGVWWSSAEFATVASPLLSSDD